MPKTPYNPNNDVFGHLFSWKQELDDIPCTGLVRVARRGRQDIDERLEMLGRKPTD